MTKIIKFKQTQAKENFASLTEKELRMIVYVFSRYIENEEDYHLEANCALAFLTAKLITVANLKAEKHITKQAISFKQLVKEYAND